MVAKVILGTMQNAKKLVNIAEHISCDVELCSGRYVVDAKSMLGVLSLPGFKVGELHIHTDEETECNRFWNNCLRLDFLQIHQMQRRNLCMILQHLGKF